MADNLTRWLVQVGLGGYAATFASQGIDWDVLGDLSEQDLKELGLPLGDRKRLLKALAALTDARSPSRDRESGRLEQPPSLAAGSFEAERRQLTVMFVDLIDSTPLTERFDPEDMRRMLGVFH
jgi:class 3 adenylate cyclase